MEDFEKQNSTIFRFHEVLPNKLSTIFLLHEVLPKKLSTIFRLHEVLPKNIFPWCYHSYKKEIF